MPSTNTSDPSQRRPPAASADNGNEPRSTSQHPKKKRVRHFTADDRAAHRLFEKERREAFRERLLALAELLPSLSDRNPQALSKHMVVEESIAHVTAQNARLDEVAQDIRALVQERDDLLSELNQWRGQAGIALRQPSDSNSQSIQQSGPEEDTQLRLSPARNNPVGIDSLFEPAPETRDLSDLPEMTQTSMPQAPLDGNNMLDPFDAGDPSAPVPLMDQPPVPPGITRPLGDAMMGTSAQVPAQNTLFDDSVCLTADMFDTSFILDALRPSTNMGPVYNNSANVLNLPADLNTHSGQYMA